MKDRKSKWILMVLMIQLSMHELTANQLFPNDQTFVFDWKVEFNTGAMLPSKMVSEWHMNSKIIIQTFNSITQMQIVNVSGSYNIDDASLLYKPFRVNYTGGYITDLYIEPDDLPWSANMKRALASIFQVNLDLLKVKALVSTAREETVYGNCAIDYVVRDSDDEKLSLHKTVNLQSCVNLPVNHWQSSPKYDCPSSFIDGSLALSERTMNFSMSDPVTIQNITASGIIEFQPFQAQAEVHHIYIKQYLTLDNLSKEKPSPTIADVGNAVRTNIVYEYLSDVDPIYGYKPSGDGIVVAKVQALLSEICESLEWEIGIKGLDNETALQVLDLMWWLETSDWEILYNNITLGTSYSQETIQHLFWDLLPQIGSNSSVIFIKELVTTGKVKGFLAHRLLSTFPFYLRHPTVQLLAQCEDLLWLKKAGDEPIDEETKHAAILSFATLVYKTCSVECSIDVVDKYTKIFLDRLTETSDYTLQMVYVHAISNMRLPKVLQFFAPQIANTSLSRHYRLLLLWATMTAIDQNPEQAKEIFWPILLNKTESLELRALSTLVLLTSAPNTARLSAIHSVMVKEESQQLYNFYYTTLQSLAKTMMPCYSKINKVVSYFVRFVPPRTHHWATGNYLLDYEDPVRGYGGLLQLLLLASEKTGLPNILHFTAEQHSLGVTSSRSVYLKLEGINYKSLWEKFFGNGEATIIKEPLLREFIKNLNLQHPKHKKENVHLEIFIKHDDHVIYCEYINETSFEKIVASIQKMSRVYLEFSVNYQSLQYPQRILTTQPTDIGTPALLTVTTSALLSARGSIQQKNDDDFDDKARVLRNIELDVRYSINSITSLRTYNPLTNIWHGADRSRSLHARIPISTQLVLHYFRSYYRITSKRHKYFKAGSRLGVVWHSTTHVVPNGLPTAENHKTEDDWSVESRDLGARLGTLVFDCQDDARIADSLVIVKQAFQTHNKNYHMVLGGVPIIGLFSLMNYFTFLPPGGSCGVVFSLSPLQVEQSILVEGSTVSVSMNQNNETVWELKSFIKRLKDGDRELSLKFKHSPKELVTVGANNTWSLIRLEGSLLIPSRKSGILKPPNAVRSQALISWGTADNPSSMEFGIAPDSKAEWPTDCSSNIPKCLQATSHFATKQKATLQYSNLPNWLKMAVRSVFWDFVKTEGNSTSLQFSFPAKLPWTTKGVCAASSKYLLTIDNATVGNYDLKPDCYTILLADCSSLSQFALGIKKNSHFKELIDLKLLHGTTQVTNMSISANSSVTVNGYIVQLTDEYITYPVNAKDNDYIFKMKKWQETMIEVDLGKSGIVIQYYGHSVVIMVDGILKGSTCGLCGDFNGEVSNELDNSVVKCGDM
ncbi:hypothetical protein WDU94_004070 [Cyamophila willieti]